MEQQNEYNGYVNKNQFALSIIFMIVITITLFLSIYFLINERIDKIVSEFSVDAPTLNELEADKISSIFLIVEENGKLAVYKDGSFQYYVDVCVSTLPDNDKKLLSEGIEVTSEQELNEIISSYY